MKALIFLAGCAGHFSLTSSGTSSSSGGSSSSSSSSGESGSASAGDVAAAYERFTILGARLGGDLEKQPGFTCGPPRGTGGFTTQNHSCVKFLDARCEGRPTKINMASFSSQIPRGQSCFMEEFNGSTYLDAKMLTPPMSALRIIGTDSNSMKIFQVVYTFAGDDLTPDSKLGKMLLAKYGKPSFSNPPIQMSWEQAGVKLSASCRTIGGDHAADGDYCTITVEDDNLDRVERAKQQAHDDEARKHDAPPPPSL